MQIYVKFMFLHKHVYYMYTRLCEFRQAPIVCGTYYSFPIFYSVL
jgi:hypothetical protein